MKYVGSIDGTEVFATLTKMSDVSDKVKRVEEKLAEVTGTVHQNPELIEATK